MDLNVFHCGGAVHVIGKIKLFFRRFKWAWQRAIKGYCDYDRWEFYQWMLTVLPNCLEEFKDNAMGHPAEYEEEQWEQMLTEIIESLRYAAQDRDNMNRYTDILMDYLDRRDKILNDNPNLGGLEHHNLEMNTNLILAQYQARDIEIRLAQEEKLRDTFSKLVDIIWNLWD